MGFARIETSLRSLHDSSPGSMLYIAVDAPRTYFLNIFLHYLTRKSFWAFDFGWRDYEWSNVIKSVLLPNDKAISYCCLSYMTILLHQFTHNINGFWNIKRICNFHGSRLGESSDHDIILCTIFKVLMDGAGSPYNNFSSMMYPCLDNCEKFGPEKMNW